MLKYFNNRIPSETQLMSLYESAGWSSYTAHPERMVPMVKASWLVLTAYENDDLVGLVRLVGDGLTIAYIQDLLVKPTFQRKGIASELMNRVAQEVRGIRQVFITTDATSSNQHVIDFYASCGFRPVEDVECVTLARRQN
ncbi:GNAT family N-acetyltransferase [Rothia amarae]|uniref:GNAT family N-acetyltransferase n=1 Tax=Rothia amarae TaxID=169480 RepID=UPI0031E3E55D